MPELKHPTLRHDLPPLPPRMRKLPLDERGYPVPFFVQWFDHGPDFRVVDGRILRVCIQRKLCWLCGEPLGRYNVFVIGPMCAVNRVSSEPPSHRDCAEFAIKACPFLIRPRAKRRESNLPDDAVDAAGVGLKRNPGVMVLWITERGAWTPFQVKNNPADPEVHEGLLFNVGEPIETLWFTEGRPATRAEAERAVTGGLPILEEMAREEGAEALVALNQQVGRALELLPDA